ncbi:hypothetical protein AXF42_Ash020743 [Apostasia shenzhenica]|uniref:DUF1421 domain-containing protein n=1 Tax=Apostasia shenzhenica TaxID=1088818 RepID=A0A2I0APL8_9ASPA|nr:hypothetical protein AXF42_Ash020743 [Apostasia shenzhenica]
MASGGSSGRSLSGTRSFDFGSDDVLCSYDDYTPQQDQSVNGMRSDLSAKDLHENRVRRPLANVYGQPEDFPREDVISAVEKCMKKYADNLMRCLEGISGRLTQLELYCYKLERSLNEFQADMTREQSESVVNIKSLEKEVHEVHRCVQIIRDKQELAETQKELTKLQLSQKEPISSTHSLRNEDSAAKLTASSERKAHTDTSDVPNLHLALSLPRQIPSPPPQLQPTAMATGLQPVPASVNAPLQPTSMATGLQPVPASVNAPPHRDRYIPNQNISFYSQHQPLPQQQQVQHLQPEMHFATQRAQMPDLSLQSPLPQQVGASQQQQFPQYQQQWPSSSQAQVLYSPYQTPNPIPETFQAPTPYPPPQYTTHRQPMPAAPVKNDHPGNNPYPSQPNIQGYNPAYAMGRSRNPFPVGFQASMSMNDPRNQYGEMIEKAVSMGYQRDQVICVLQRMGEAGQPLDFNALLDGLNAPPRAWSS